MSSIKPTLPRGTRDFSPDLMVKRNYILQTIRSVFEEFGFLPIETPALENLSVLTGKYGDEGDKLIFKILNSGNFLDGIELKDIGSADPAAFSGKVSEKGLRYDLTVPFARYVVMNRNDIVFPFRRYQVQPVWRADRPQKGRYREFFQCDADVIGSDSLICEAEIIIMIQEICNRLNLGDYILKINSRKILEGMAEAAGNIKKADTFFVILDKLEKTGRDNFRKSLLENGFTDKFIKQIENILDFSGTTEEKIEFLTTQLRTTSHGQDGLNEIHDLVDYVESLGGDLSKLDFDITLARGLSYYTGVIMEATATKVKIGSIGGGGRYDNLTGVFGLPDMSGVGFSFGIDRVYDVLEEMNLFDNSIISTTEIMLTNFGPGVEKVLLSILSKLRKAGVRAELYPDSVKLKKQLNYANKRNIPYVLIIGSEEAGKGVCTLKNMEKGDQKELTVEQLIKELS